MPTLSASQLASMIKYHMPVAPITQQNGVIAIAVALAESSGNTDAVGGPNANGTRDWGLWQINDIHTPTDHQKKSPSQNWLLAWRIAGMGTSWRPWVTYQNGKHRQYMDAAFQAWRDAEPSLAGITPGTEILGESYEALPEYLSFLEPFLDSDTWIRVAMALAGIVLLALVGSVFARQFTPLGAALKGKAPIK